MYIYCTRCQYLNYQGCVRLVSPKINTWSRKISTSSFVFFPSEDKKTKNIRILNLQLQFFNIIFFAILVYVRECARATGVLHVLFLWWHADVIMNTVCCFLFFQQLLHFELALFISYFFQPVCANGMLISAQRATAAAAPSVGVYFFFISEWTLLPLCLRGSVWYWKTLCIFLFFLF